ncbi:BON domain-containing protein [Allorhodopirellula solitaria]|uniref:BON domain protein n=1 Tax=Allorhodopirellula solitaria TaxID=2527987 RepID=A0A5C5WZR0_9BACT|nr:BON domain-containing protein [Allorhodopirellula solitaria]TWT56060.1 BON domain protein [Allorhodopirellula solitaria]
MLGTILAEPHAKQHRSPTQPQADRRAGSYLAKIEQAVIHRLWHSGRSTLHAVKCSCSRTEGGRTLATLTGQLPSFYLKQVAQEIVRYVDGVERIDNKIEVIDANQVESTGLRSR